MLSGHPGSRFPASAPISITHEISLASSWNLDQVSQWLLARVKSRIGWHVYTCSTVGCGEIRNRLTVDASSCCCPRCCSTVFLVVGTYGVLITWIVLHSRRGDTHHVIEYFEVIVLGVTLLVVVCNCGFVPSLKEGRVWGGETPPSHELSYLKSNQLSF